MIDKLEKFQCTGCKACGDICPKSAIIFKNDEEGFWYPEIDYVKCVSCGLCEKICPAENGIDKKTKINNKMTRYKEPDVLQVYNMDDEVRISSTSGGVYYALAETFLSKGGVIAGCVYNEDWSGAHHVIARDKAGLDKIYGSKYFQSDTEGIFREIENVLDSGEELLFCGSPCQVAGLYNYLKKQYANLYTVDFICRGINSPKAYRAYMEELQKKHHSQLKKVHFKNKTQGWINLGTRVEFQNGKVYFRNRHTDPWVNGFINGNLYMRPACASCRFKSLPRIADISFGDFWGIKYSKEDAFKGVSLVLLNSEKGKKLFGLSKNKLIVKQGDLDTALRGNPAILNAIPMGQKREEFFENIEKEDFSKLVWRLIGWSSPKWQIRYFVIKLKDAIGRFRK